jgi:hypothetical protein
MKRTWAGIVLATGLIALSQPCKAIDASSLGELQGYTIVAATHSTGELEGADFDKLVKLDNGMIFEFQSYDYFYEYRPDVIVFAKSTVLLSGKAFTSYKLVIADEDEVFDVMRVK